MIFGWLENGRTDRWVLVDPVFPWPALANGRAALRAWASGHNRERALSHTAGPRRCPWPCQTNVKSDGNVELRIWPVAPYARPRKWSDADRVWRPAIAELAEMMASTIACPVEVLWLGGDTIERAVTEPDLQGRGFFGWGKGEQAPKHDDPRPPDPELASQLRIGLGGADLNILPQGDDAWH